MDINKASAEELERTFEVDGQRARYIIDKRNQVGGFENWEQIKEIVPSIDEKMVENLRAAGLTIGRTGTSGEGERANRSEAGMRESTAAGRDRSGRDVNTVSREELERVCQIDGQRADYFLSAREKSGGFRSWEQIKNEVPSFDDGMVERLQKAGFSVGSEQNRAA